MPALAWKLTDDQVAAVVTYIRNSWGNSGSAVGVSDVKSTRQQLQAAGINGQISEIKHLKCFRTVELPFRHIPDLKQYGQKVGIVGRYSDRERRKCRKLCEVGHINMPEGAANNISYLISTAIGCNSWSSSLYAQV